MKLYILSFTILLALFGCDNKEKAALAPSAAKPAAGDVVAGKAIAERECKGCHGLDGKSIAPGIPDLAAQRGSYLVAALQAYKDGKRNHAALKDMMQRMSDADMRNVAAYYAGLPPVAVAAGKDIKSEENPYERGKTLATPCAKCHSEDGNSKTPGIPGLAGQQPNYFVLAIQEYLHKDRQKAPMHEMLPGLSRQDMENLALYFASQTPAQREAPAVGDPAAGEPLTAVCGGCHGSHGVSTDSATPALAGQDAKYLVDAIKAYRTTRKRESMRIYVTGLGEKDIENIAAFYSAQKGRPAEKGQTIVQDITGKCNRCHTEAENPAMVVPKIRGQDKDYLVMAMRAYRDGKRENSMMHIMSLPYSDTIVESVAAYYAAQPAK